MSRSIRFALLASIAACEHANPPPIAAPAIEHPAPVERTVAPEPERPRPRAMPMTRGGPKWKHAPERIRVRVADEEPQK